MVTDARRWSAAECPTYNFTMGGRFSGDYITLTGKSWKTGHSLALVTME